MFAYKLSRAGAWKVWSILIVAGVIGLLLVGCKEEPKVFRVGILSGLNYVADITDGFKEGMAELGYVEGENIIYDVQKTDFDMEAYQQILDQFVADKVDLIVVFPTEASILAKETTKGTDIPVLFTFALIEEMGLVDSIAVPGGNITGVRYPGPDVMLKRFEILLALAPDAERIWLPYQRGYPIVEPQLDELYPVAEAADVTLIEAPADNAAELETEMAKLIDEDGKVGIDAILILIEPLAVTPDALLVMARFAEEHQIPIGGALMEVDGYGTIFGVNVETKGSGKDAAPLADKILKGTPAGTIPVYSAESYLEVNIKTAKKLGVKVPESILNQANNIIE
ncbi:MAG: ABC transporter substrate-binding protein [Anaerolineae bacterium]|nr:ABC transporter substrate-binding protein [Anaerolineae bacterium]